MPDLLHRPQIEDRLTETINKLLQQQKREFAYAIQEAPPEEQDRKYAAIWIPRFKRLAEVLVVGLAIPLADIHRFGRKAVDKQFGLHLDPDFGDQLSLQWGVSRAKTAANLITTNTQKMLAAANGKDLPSDATRKEILDASLDIVFGRDRAENIAITETTGANAAGEFAARDMAARAQKPRTIYAHWQTEEDDRVCPICLPLDNKPEYLWIHKFPMGPPAHNRCRCFIAWSEQSPT